MKKTLENQKQHLSGDLRKAMGDLFTKDENCEVCGVSRWTVLKRVWDYGLINEQRFTDKGTL